VSGRNTSVRVLVSLAALGAVAASFGQVTLFNSASAANNAATKNSWLTAAGISAGDVFQDFESYALGTNLNGSAVGGGLTISELSANPFMQVQSSGLFFGGSVPFGKGLALKENRTVRFDFDAPISYFSLYSLDDGGSDVRVHLENGTFVDFNNLDNAGSGGANAEFLGIFAAGPKIVRIDYAGQGGEGEYGFDNFEYQAVPEPGLLLAGGVGLALLVKRRRNQAK
jgi:hypothetical protein